MTLPYYFRIPFGFAGDRTSIPVTGSNSGPVNFQYGYGEPYSLPRSTDPAALTIPRVSFNQLLFNTTASIQQLQQYGVPYFITAADNGGTAFAYQRNAVVRYNNGTTEENYLSLVDSNTALPTVTANWAQLRSDPAYLGLAQTFTQIQTISASGAPLVLNSTNSTTNKIRMRDNGVDVGYIGAGGGYFLRVSDAAGNAVGGWNNSGHLVPVSNNAYDVGTSALLYRALYSATTYANSVQANGSGGIALKNSSGTDVLTVGAGGGTATAVAGALNVTGKTNTSASTTGGAGLNIAPGTAPTSPSNGDIWLTSGGVFARVNGATQQFAAVGSVASQAFAPGGRLTLTTGVPVTTTDVTSSSTLFYTPYVSNQIALYNGTAWSLYTFTERSLALSGLTSGRPYDVFLYDNAGTLTLELTAWTNDTTRATALVYQDGVLVRSGATTRRYLGTIYTTGTTTTEDSRANRYVWNYYNRQHREMLRTDATVSWNYSTTTWRQANGSTTNQLNFVVGVSESIVTCQLVGTVRNSTATARGVFAQIALDNTTGSSFAGLGGGFSVVAIDVNFTIVANTLVAAGRHYLAWLEYGAGTDTQTWSGGNARGLTGTIWA